jgi:endo-1,4-beta-xylanase
MHGMDGNPAAALPMALRLELEIARGHAPQMIVAAADGFGKSMWVDWQDGSCPAETVVVRDLREHVESAWRGIPERGGRAVEGFSMGGFGAAHHGFKHPDLFCAVSVLSGALHTPEQLREHRPPRFEEAFGGDMDFCVAESPWTLVEENTSKIRDLMQVRIRVGAEDGLRPMNEAFSARLDDLHIRHTFGLVDSEGHRLGHFFDHLNDPFEIYVKAFAESAGEIKPAPNPLVVADLSDRLREAMMDRESHRDAEGVEKTNALVEEFRGVAGL